MPGIDYILQSTNPYPDWIKNHRIFKELSRIEKVFPQIGLANYSEEVSIVQTDSARKAAGDLHDWLSNQLSVKTSQMPAVVRKVVLSTESGREHNKRCNDYQYLLGLITSCYHSIANSRLDQIATLVDKKISMLMPTSVYGGGAKTDPVFKKGQNLFGVIASLNELIEAAAGGKTAELQKIPLETSIPFKEFSAKNVPAKPFKIHFSSTGSEGAWNIATASMRGITSCQAWTSAQSRGLIGSISSRYVAVCFIEGHEEFKPYGKKMVYRSMVRVVIEKNTGKPYLYFDHIYPNSTSEVIKVISESVGKRTSLPLLFNGNGNDKVFVQNNCVIMNEPSRSFLAEGEFSYLDTPMPVVSKPFSSFKPISSQEKNAITAKQKLRTALLAAMKEKHLAYIVLDTKFKAGESPDYAPLYGEKQMSHKAIKSILNFYKHFSRNSASANCTDPIIDAILNAIPLSEETRRMPAIDIERKFLREIIMQHKKIKEDAKIATANGSWNKAFQRTTDRFMDTAILAAKSILHPKTKS